jgi:hypothetical protein
MLRQCQSGMLRTQPSGHERRTATRSKGRKSTSSRIALAPQVEGDELGGLAKEEGATEPLARQEVLRAWSVANELQNRSLAADAPATSARRPATSVGSCRSAGAV